MLNEDEIGRILSETIGDDPIVNVLIRDLYARVLAAEARIAALESPAPSDPVTDASAAMEGWQAVPHGAMDKEGVYLQGFADGVKYGRGRKTVPGDLDAEEAKAWAAFNGSGKTMDDRETFNFVYCAGWVARGRK